MVCTGIGKTGCARAWAVHGMPRPSSSLSTTAVFFQWWLSWYACESHQTDPYAKGSLLIVTRWQENSSARRNMAGKVWVLAGLHCCLATAWPNEGGELITIVEESDKSTLMTIPWPKAAAVDRKSPGKTTSFGSCHVLAFGFLLRKRWWSWQLRRGQSGEVTSQLTYLEKQQEDLVILSQTPTLQTVSVLVSSDGEFFGEVGRSKLVEWKVYFVANTGVRS